MKVFNKYFIIFTVAFAPLTFFITSCAQFKSAEYKSSTDDYVAQGEFSTPEELYSSKDVIKINEEHPDAELKLIWPVDKISISRGFTTGGKKEHKGLDLRGKKGDPIHAAHSGTVIYAGHGFRGYGRMVILEFSTSWATLYGHMSRIKVKTGMRVKAGQVIGLMGRTGRATGVHLHFEVMHDKIPTDPISILGTNIMNARSENDETP